MNSRRASAGRKKEEGKRYHSLPTHTSRVSGEVVEREGERDLPAPIVGTVAGADVVDSSA